jgi:hypothetical protein
VLHKEHKVLQEVLVHRELKEQLERLQVLKGELD